MSYIISFIVDTLFFLLHIVELGLSGPFVSSFGFVLLLILPVLLLRPIVNTNSPCLTSLNSDMASWCVIPWTALPLIENISSPMNEMNKCIGKCITVIIINKILIWPIFIHAILPSIKDPRAWPVGIIVLTYIPIFPFGLSFPPTMEKPKLFWPGPFLNFTLWIEYCCEAPRERLGRVQNLDDVTTWFELVPV